MKLSDLRRDFGKHDLQEAKLPASPIMLFHTWLEKASASGLPDFNAMILSTVGRQGKPSSRVILLKEVNTMGALLFYTHYGSQKGEDLKSNSFAALHFFWAALEQQIRIEGEVAKIEVKKSDDYFASRPRESQVSAIISPQSEQIKSLEELERKRNDLLKSNVKLNRPKYWGGYELRPQLFEFWQGGTNRMHHRILYQLDGSKWKMSRLAP